MRTVASALGHKEIRYAAGAPGSAMGMSKEQFVASLLESGLMTPEALQEFLDSLPAGRQHKDGSDLAKDLVQRKRLSLLQAAAVYQKKTTTILFGNYTIVDRIGAGGMGLIYKAQHRTTGAIVALKVVHPAAMQSAEMLERFQREVQAIRGFDHPNLVRAVDAAVRDGVWYLAMDYVEGRDFKTVIKDEGPLSIARATNYIVQAARGLHHVHCKGVVHRDVKPSNLMLDTEGIVRVLDLGLARLHTDAQASLYIGGQLTQQGQMLGTAAYVAPEQVRDPHAADHRSDIYSLGCTLHFLLTGQSPYENDNSLKVFMAHQTAPIPHIRDIRPDVPTSLDAVFRKMLSKKPQERHPSMREVVHELEPFLPAEALHLVEHIPPLPERVVSRAEKNSTDSELARRGPERTIDLEELDLGDKF